MSSTQKNLQHITLNIDNAVATITLNRPDALNSFTDQMESDLVDAFRHCDADDSVRVVLLTGAGRAFCAGMDLSDSAATFDSWRNSKTAEPGTQFDIGDDQLPLRRDGGGRVVLQMFECRKPIIAAINGHAVGVGITMTLAADIRILADDAKVGFVFNRRGIVPESCSTWFLPRIVPMQRALEWVLTGRVFDAQEALAGGLVRSLHPRDQVLAVANELAREIADQTAPVSAALARQLMWRMLGAAHPMEAHQAETHALNLRGLSADAAEGISAFLEKRQADFPDTVSSDLPNVLADFSTPSYQPPTSI